MSNSKSIRKAVIPAAGLGTRMLPATKVVPNEMLPAAGKPLIQYAIEEAAASGIGSLIIVICLKANIELSLHDPFLRKPLQ